MEKRCWMGALLLPTLTLVILFLLSPSTRLPHWQQLQQALAPAPPACRPGMPPGSRTRAVGIQWQPRRDRHLVLICDSGQITNHLICLRKHMYIAALLNRTLVLPPRTLDYQYEHLLDIAHLQHCLGKSTIISFEAFRHENNHQLHIDKLVCFMPNCYFDQERQTRWEALGFTFGPRQDARQPRRRDAVLARLAAAGADADAVIAVGDLFYAEVEDSDDFALTHQCSLQLGLVRPHPSIVLAAQRFVQTYLGSNFLAVHFRRHGFLVFCNKRTPGPSCFYPIPQAARCIEAKVREVGADVVFLSTDAAGSEVEALVAALHQRGVLVVRRTASHEALAKWDAVLWRQAGREAEEGVMAMVDKAICSLAVVFLGTRDSSFSAHIQSMRLTMATASFCDAPLCHDQGAPSFIAASDL